MHSRRTTCLSARPAAKRRRGAVVVEFAIVAPVFLLIVFICILLSGCQIIPVVHVNFCICRVGEAGYLHPGNELPGGAIEIFDLMVQLGGAVRAGEENVIIVILSIGS